MPIQVVVTVYEPMSRYTDVPDFRDIHTEVITTPTDVPVSTVSTVAVAKAGIEQVARIFSTGDAYVAIGPTPVAEVPNPTSTTSFFVPAGFSLDIGVQKGDHVAVISGVSD